MVHSTVYDKTAVYDKKGVCQCSHLLSLSVWALGSVLAERVGAVRWVGVTNGITAHGCVSTKWAIPVHTSGIN